MFKAYRKIKPVNKALILAALVLLSFAISFTYGYNSLLVTPAVLAICVAAHIGITYPRLAVSVVASSMQVFAVSFIALVLGVIYSAYGAEGDFNTVVATYWILFTVAISWLVAFYWSNGRIWLNLIISYLLYDATLVALNLIGVDFVWSLLGSTGIALLYLAVRGVRARKPVLPPTASLRLNKGSVTEILKNKGYTVSTTEDQNIIATHVTKKPVFVIALKGKKIDLEKNSILLDETDITSTLEYASEQAKATAKLLKISYSLFHTVVFFAAPGSKNDLLSVDVYAKTRPDRRIGKVFIANSTGLNRFLNISSKNDKKLSKKASEKLSKAVQV